MHKHFQFLFAGISKFHSETFKHIKAAEHIVTNTADLQELADAVYVLRELEELIDDARKQIARLKDVAENRACVIWVSGQDAKPIRTPYCTATPKMTFHHPEIKRKNDPEAYDALMASMGVPKEIAEKELLRTHWPTFSGYLGDLAAEGKPFPAGIDPAKTKPIYRLTIRKTEMPIGETLGGRS
jgi:hypothetical protein